MLLRNRVPSIDTTAVSAAKGYEHVAASSIAVMRWLNESGVDYVLVGSVARAIRGDAAARGPVDIVPAPYGRNLDRLANAINAVGARERTHGELIGAIRTGGGQQLKLSADLLVRTDRWALRCADHELDIEGRPSGTPSYQELLYEAVRFQVSPEVSIEVAATEDIEHYDHVRRTGLVPEMTVKRL
ncbi:MAG TPA: hypothetical protein VHV75_00775 [Solirubrobacteraceae bacterium]|jgi:hypothetical protein|nr:hypothetical protein [Solirubrobacteraceae bacterium]